MRDWNIPDSDEMEDSRVHRTKHFNKEKFCKKNKLGYGQYGPHEYVNDRCRFCNKIDPRVKHTNYEE